MWKTLQLLAAPGLGVALLSTWAQDSLGHARIRLYSALDGADRFHAGSPVSLAEFRFIGDTGLWLGRVITLLLVLSLVGLVGITFFQRPPRRIHLTLCALLGAALFASLWFVARVTSSFLESTFSPWLAVIALLCGLVGTAMPLVGLDRQAVDAATKPLP